MCFPFRFCMSLVLVTTDPRCTFITYLLLFELMSVLVERELLDARKHSQLKIKNRQATSATFYTATQKTEPAAAPELPPLDVFSISDLDFFINAVNAPTVLSNMMKKKTALLYCYCSYCFFAR